MSGGYWVLIGFTVLVLAALAVAGFTTCYAPGSCEWENRR